MGQLMRTDHVCDLVLEACDLLDRAREGADPAAALCEAEALRAELCAAIAGCDDDAVAADGQAAVCDLDALVARLDAPALPVPHAA
jgi:hypothetical protein